MTISFKLPRVSVSDPGTAPKPLLGGVSDPGTDADPFEDEGDVEVVACEREPHFPVIAPKRVRYCERCSAVLTGRSDQRTCSGACRSAVNRRAKVLLPILRVIARMLEGDMPGRGEAPPRWWGLISRLLLSERVKARNRIKARLLPGGGA